MFLKKSLKQIQTKFLVNVTFIILIKKTTIRRISVSVNFKYYLSI